MDRKEFIRSGVKLTGGLVAGSSLLACSTGQKSKNKEKQMPVKGNKPMPLAITMWDFSWLERRWPGAGYEDYDLVLDELKERGYDAVRIDPYPHLVHKDPFKEYELIPHWNTHDWGSPDYIRITVEPHLTEFVTKCKERNIKVSLSSWWREDTERSYDIITTPEKLAEVWLSVLDLLEERELLDAVTYVDLTNEWTLDEWTPYKKGLGGWASEESIDIWMVNYNNGEFYNEIDYHYEAFDPVGYQKVAKYAEKLYREKPEYWNEGLRKQIHHAADWSRHSGKPLITTECWGLVTYKDWPLLNWNWIMDLCELGVREAAATGRWAAIATSNFCGPQFVGMWQDVEWHKKLTKVIHSSQIDAELVDSFNF